MSKVTKIATAVAISAALILPSIAVFAHTAEDTPDSSVENKARLEESQKNRKANLDKARQERGEKLEAEKLKADRLQADRQTKLDQKKREQEAKNNDVDVSDVKVRQEKVRAEAKAKREAMRVCRQDNRKAEVLRRQSVKEAELARREALKKVNAVFVSSVRSANGDKDKIAQAREIRSAAVRADRDLFEKAVDSAKKTRDENVKKCVPEIFKDSAKE